MKSLMILISIIFLATSSFAAEISEREVNTFMGEWFEAQNTGSYSKYAAMYSNNFIGIRRSGTSTRKFDHDAWLKDRKQMFKKKMIVSGGVLEIKLSSTTASVKFAQTWESGTYTDKGDKLLILAIEKGKLKIIREEMLFSRVVSIIDVEDSEISTITTGTTLTALESIPALSIKIVGSQKDTLPNISILPNIRRMPWAEGMAFVLGE